MMEKTDRQGVCVGVAPGALMTTSQGEKREWNKHVSTVVRLRRALRELSVLRKFYDWGQGVLTKPADPMTLRLVPEEAFRKKAREIVASMIETQGKENIGDYVEFGVFNGTTLSIVYEVFQEFGLNKARFFGFDSFEGLPPEADSEGKGMWFSGQCSCSLEVTTAFLNARQVDWNRTFLVKGWFKDTLTSALVEQAQMKKASLIMVDSDLYSSAVDCLRFVEPLIHNEAIVMFDDWNGFQAAEKNLGEKKAFDEFLARHPEIKAAEMGSYSDEFLIFRVVRI